MALAYLAGKNEYHSVRSIVAALGLPQRLLAEVLKQLSHAGIVAAHRGPAGGYRLDGPASDITLARVVLTLEGPTKVTECHGGHCDLEFSCNIRQGMLDVGDRIQDILERTTVQDLARPPAQRAEATSFPA